MKRLLWLFVGFTLAAPGSAFAIQKFQRTGEIDKTKEGGYADTQTDPHAKRAKQIKEKTGAGYRNGSYHNTGENYKPGEWQFVGASKGGGSSKHHQKQGKKHPKKKAN